MREKQFNVKLTSDEIKFIQKSMLLYVSQYSKFYPDADMGDLNNCVDSANYALDLSKKLQESRRSQLTQRQFEEELSNGHGWIY